MMNRMKGTSLVETIIALAIMAIVILCVVAMLSVSSTLQRHSRAVAEVESQSNYALGQITQSIRNASSITSPATSTMAAAITLASNVSTDNPTVFALSSTTLTMAKNGGAALPLTTNTVSVTALTFQNVSTTTAHAVRVNMTMSYYNSTNNPALNYSNTYTTTVTLR